MGQLFGTDGIRGVANQYPMTCHIAMKIGQAVGVYCKESGFSSVIIGKDTRISGDMLEAALSAGVTSTGIQVLLAGVIPTPGVAFLCRDFKEAGAGIVISASHNPYQDNGIKIFKNGGVKLSDAEEASIESFVLENKEISSQSDIGKIRVLSDSLERYTSFLCSKFPVKKPQKKLKLVIDCSNGAASKIGHMVFNRALFDARFIHNTPNGTNINSRCGSQHTRDLQTAVTENAADLGLAFDGDADRLIVVDEKGNQITGDCILAICAKYARKNNALKNNTLVSTIMSNVGLTQALNDMKIRHLKADVGDRKVLEEMQASGAVIGGEDSGHIIFLQDHTTGDGMLSALKLIEVMLNEKKAVSDLASVMTVYPQVLMNVEVDTSRPDFMTDKSIADTINGIEKKLGNNGRVLVRYSGTQPLLRVMVEGPDKAKTHEYCELICNTVRRNLGKQQAGNGWLSE